MRFLPGLILTVRAHSTIGDDVTDLDHPSVGDALLHHDIVLTPCQAERYREKGFNITDEVILADEGFDTSCEADSDNPRALQVTD